MADALCLQPRDGQEFVALNLSRPDRFTLSNYADGETHAELLTCLEEFVGDEVALGPCPEYWREDHEGLVSASKGGIDGPR